LGVITSTKPIEVGKDTEIAKLLEELSDFQYLLLMSMMDPTMNSLLKSAFHFFTHSDATFVIDPPQIVLGPLEEQNIMNEKQFYDL
jgi:hypothetical protein